MEQVLDWLNENEFRAYPLLEDYAKTVNTSEGIITLTDNIFLDLQLIVTTQDTSADNSPLSRVYYNISAIKRTGDELEFTFGFKGYDDSNYPAVEEVSGDFTKITVSSIDSNQYPLYLRTTDGNLAVFGEGLKELKQACPDLTTIPTDIAIEHTVCTQFDNAWLGVSSLSVSPEKTTKSDSFEPQLPLENTLTQTKLTGDVKLLPGYNFRVDISNNLIDLEVGSSYGLRMSCTTSFIPTEYLDCDQLVSYINGVPPSAAGDFSLSAGSDITLVNGHTVASDYDHTLFVGLTFQSSDICAPLNLNPSVL